MQWPEKKIEFSIYQDLEICKRFLNPDQIIVFGTGNSEMILVTWPRKEISIDFSLAVLYKIIQLIDMSTAGNSG